jgi:AraC-like DNA-binding protein
MAAAQIALTRVRGMGGLPNLVGEAVGWRALERLFGRLDLPVAVLAEPDMAMPLDVMIDLFEEASREVGDHAFGLRVGQAMTFADYGLWGRYVGSAPMLAMALVRAGQTIRIYQTGAWMGMRQEKNHTIFYYARQHNRRGSPGRQHADHVIWPMITVVREFLGPTWMPDWVEVNYPSGTGVEALVDRLKVPVLFSKPGVGIAIPSYLLRCANQRPIGLEKHVSRAELLAKYAGDHGGSFGHMVRATVSLRLLDGKTDIDGTARMLGVSIRKLQRLLDVEGISYRHLVEQGRCKRAIALLQEHSASVTAIALSLGYEEPGNFTRAFRRWTGQTPNAFRDCLKEPPARATSED